MSGGSYTHLASPATFRFTNLGPVRDASLQLGRLTVVAGRNNTGKSYIANVLHGFLKTWEDWSGAPKYLLRAPVGFPNIEGIAETLANRGRAVIPLDPDGIQYQRRTLLHQVGRGFSQEGIPYALGLTNDGFAESSLSVEIEDSDATWAPRPMGTSFRRTEVSMSHDGARLVALFREKGPAETIERIEVDTAWSYYHFLLRGLLPPSFVLSSDRAGISLFHRELDFMKSEVTEVLHKLGDEASRRSVAPILFLTERSDRHSLSVNDDVDFTRHVAELRGEAASLPHAQGLATQLRSMVGGYYASARDDIRFISRGRGADRGFNIPLSLASSSARGLSALYFYLRHQAALGHLLVIDGPENHLDTRNQVRLARLLARFVASGLRVLITTHSDYLVKELNNLIMLGRDFRGKIALARKLGYKAREEIDPGLVRAYVAGDGGLTECGIGPFGIEMPVFDETIDSINKAAIELSSRAEGAK